MLKALARQAISVSEGGTPLAADQPFPSNYIETVRTTSVAGDNTSVPFLPFNASDQDRLSRLVARAARRVNKLEAKTL